MPFTLKQISAMPPSNYYVIDSNERKGHILSWSDRIEIIYNNKSKSFTRKGAYAKGLASKAQHNN